MYLDIRERAFNCLAAFNVHIRICSVKVSRWSTIIPKTFTAVWEWRQTSSLIVSICGYIFSDDIIMDLNLDGLAFIPLSPNHLNEIWQSLLRLDKLNLHLATSVTQNYHLRSCKSYSFSWMKAYHSEKHWRVKDPISNHVTLPLIKFATCYDYLKSCNIADDFGGNLR